MSEEEIKKLSREYADDTVESYGFSAETVKELKEDQADKALSVISFLLHDYCIVPKSKVISNYQSLKNDLPDYKTDPKRHFGFLGGMTELELLFGKELFEQKGE